MTEKQTYKVVRKEKMCIICLCY